MKKDSINIEISLKTLITITVFFALMILAWHLRTVFVLVFIAFILKSALRPYIDYFESKSIPRIVSTLGIYLLLFVLSTGIAVTLFSETIQQLKNLIELMPHLIGNILQEFLVLFPWLGESLNLDEIKSTFVDDIANLSRIFTTGVNSAFVILNSAFSAIGIMVAILTVSVYMLVRKKEVYESIINYLPIKHSLKESYAELLEKIELKLGAWMRAQIFLMILIGIMTWVGLSLPALFIESYTINQFALPIAFVASIMEMVPSLGPVITAIFAIIIAIGSGASFLTVLYIIILFVAIQQLEGIFVVPKLMEKVIGLDPIITVVSVMGAFILFGFIGAILVIPLLAVVQIVLESEITKYKKNSKLN